MTDKEKDLMDRYVYEVTRRISKNMREEVRLELEELIGDMYESRERKGEPDQSLMEEVLEELGRPAEFAGRYRDEKKFLISPEYYDNFILTLKIVLVCVMASTVLAGVISMLSITETSINAIVDAFVEFFVDLIISPLCAFGSVTLVFVILERSKVKMDMASMGEWKAANLPPIPEKKAIISRSESIVGIIFLAVFGGLFLTAPELIGAYVFKDKEFVECIPVFNLEKWNVILPFMVVSFLVAFLDDMIRLIAGRYCNTVMISNLISGVIQFVLSVIMLKVLPIWNMDFASEVREKFLYKASSEWDIMSYWGTDTFSNVMLFIFFAIILLEMVDTIYKTLKYKR